MKGARFARAVGQVLLNIAALGGLVCVALVVLALTLNISLIMFKTGSMAPTITAGSVAVVREIPASEIEVGDIVTVDRGRQLPVTHRVTSVSAEAKADAPTETHGGHARTITMKGDANETEDPAPYVVTDVRRVLFAVPGLASLIVWFSNPLVLGAITIAASVLVTWAFWPKNDRRSRGSHQATNIDGANVHLRLASKQPPSRTSSTKLLTWLIGLVAASAMFWGQSDPALAQQQPGSIASDVADVTVTRGKHLTLTSIGDSAAMNEMVPGVPVRWQVGVQVDAPDPGVVEISMEGRGSPDLGLVVETRACDTRWVDDRCGGQELQVNAGWRDGVVGVNEGPKDVTIMRDTEERWVLVIATIPQPGNGTVSLKLRASGESESVETGTDTIGLANTGADGSRWVRPEPWLAGGAIAMGLAAAGVARLMRSRRRGSSPTRTHRRAAGALVSLAFLALLIAPPPGETEASWVDPEASAASFETITVPAPTYLGCRASGLLGLLSTLRIDWQAPANADQLVLEVGRMDGGLLVPLTQALLGDYVATEPISGNPGAYRTTVSVGALLGTALGGSTVIGLRYAGPNGENDWKSDWLRVNGTWHLLGLFPPTCQQT